MISVSQIKVQASKEEKCDVYFLLKKKAAAVLKIHPEDISELSITRRSIDARQKPDIYYLYSVELLLTDSVLKDGDEAGFLRRLRLPENRCRLAEGHKYIFSQGRPHKGGTRPVIVGAGPAGLFCGYMLAVNGYAPVIIERGRDVDGRHADVEEYWKTGILKKDSNVQFGEGGAGAFSDGKLNTVVKDPHGRNEEVLRIFIECGAPEEIAYDAKPHIGTDILMGVVKKLREDIIKEGGEVRFSTCLEDLHHTDSGCRLRLSDGSELDTGAVVLALGHSARDTFSMLFENNIPMEAKPFAVGLRVEHPRLFIDRSQYGNIQYDMPAANYKLTARSEDGRGVYTFCMCPGGYVVNASSETGRLAVNGMSYSGRDGSNSNSAVVISVSPSDFGGTGPLAGIEFQRKLEEKAFASAGGKVPYEKYGDFAYHVTGSRQAAGTFSAEYPDFGPAVKGMCSEAPVHDIMPAVLNKAFVEGMTAFQHRIHGYADSDVILEGIESRTSSPVRILRNAAGQSEMSGIFPCGEGAGYAGGIMSAAIDGIYTAENVAAYMNEKEL